MYSVQRRQTILYMITFGEALLVMGRPLYGQVADDSTCDSIVHVHAPAMPIQGERPYTCMHCHSSHLQWPINVLSAKLKSKSKSTSGHMPRHRSTTHAHRSRAPLGGQGFL